MGLRLSSETVPVFPLLVSANTLASGDKERKNEMTKFFAVEEYNLHDSSDFGLTGVWEGDQFTYDPIYADHSEPDLIAAEANAREENSGSAYRYRVVVISVANHQ